jgi:predicted AAA+ superfamily ATPase
MSETSSLADTLRRIADALERLAPPAPAEPDFTAASFFRFDGAANTFRAAETRALALDLLIGVEPQKALVTLSLGRFAQGLPINHLLLWGARGTGKSSLAKAATAAQAKVTPELKLVELDRDHLSALPGLFDRLRGRAELFVVFCDDLSFEAGADQAKSLKSALEGGVGGPPDNVLFIATSNRRHLAPERHDEAAGMLAAAEQAEETVSVSDRFGLWIGFPPMDQPAYLAAVKGYAERFGLTDEDLEPTLELRALQWARRRGGRSGRVAWQFIKDLAGERGVAL